LALPYYSQRAVFASLRALFHSQCGRRHLADIHGDVVAICLTAVSAYCAKQTAGKKQANFIIIIIKGLIHPSLKLFIL